MDIKNTYPPATSPAITRRKLLTLLRWPFILAAIASVAVNIAVGGPLWCIIAVFSLYAIWNLLISTDLVEYNRTSQSIKILAYSSLLLALIDVFIVSLIAIFVIPIVCFGGLTVCIVLFFSNMEKQKHNMLPLLNFTFASVIASAYVIAFEHGVSKWPYIVLLSLSVAFILALIIVLRQDFKIELKRRFHLK